MRDYKKPQLEMMKRIENAIRRMEFEKADSIEREIVEEGYNFVRFIVDIEGHRLVFEEGFNGRFSLTAFDGVDILSVACCGRDLRLTCEAVERLQIAYSTKFGGLKTIAETVEGFPMVENAKA